MRDDAVDPLTSIREFEENEDINIMNTQGKTSRTSNEHVKSYISLMKSQKKTEKEVKVCSECCSIDWGGTQLFLLLYLYLFFLRPDKLSE